VRRILICDMLGSPSKERYDINAYLEIKVVGSAFRSGGVSFFSGRTSITSHHGWWWRYSPLIHGEQVRRKNRHYVVLEIQKRKLRPKCHFISGLHNKIGSDINPLLQTLELSLIHATSFRNCRCPLALVF
jgi:hypothetical protein